MFVGSIECLPPACWALVRTLVVTCVFDSSVCTFVDICFILVLYPRLVLLARVGTQFRAIAHSDMLLFLLEFRVSTLRLIFLLFGFLLFPLVLLSHCACDLSTGVHVRYTAAKLCGHLLSLSALRGERKVDRAIASDQRSVRVISVPSFFRFCSSPFRLLCFFWLSSLYCLQVMSQPGGVGRMY